MDASEKIKANNFCIAYHKLKLLLCLHIIACKLLLEANTYFPKMWTLFISCREARELCLFYLKTIALLIFIFHNVITHGKSHELGNGKGSFCKSDNDCDKTRFLDCVGVDGTCDCNKASWLVWVPEENSCMLMEDSFCGKKANGPKCITNSSCFNGRCDCDDDFLRDGFGACDLSCACDLPGSPRYGKDDQLECMDNAECTGSGESGFCKCKPGFSQAPNLTCMLDFDEKCSSDFDAPQCNSYQFLICRDGRCGCKFYSQMKYDAVTNQCSILVGESCDVKSKDVVYFEEFNGADTERMPKCITNSFCKPRHNGGKRGNCECERGLSALADGTCSRYNRGHGFQCSTSTDCDKDKFLVCVMDESEGSRCDCPQSEMFYDGQHCRVGPGRSCLENKLCAENSYCDGEWCVCPEGYKIDSMSCVPKVTTSANNVRNSSTSELSRSQGQIPPVNEQNHCNDLPQTSELWDRCHHCQEKLHSHIWIQEGPVNDCPALVGTKCFEDTECVPHAICDSDVYTCQCSSIAYTTKYRTCDIIPGNPKPHIQCTDIHTLKSVRSQGDVHDNAPKAQSCVVGVFFVVIVAILCL